MRGAAGTGCGEILLVGFSAVMLHEGGGHIVLVFVEGICIVEFVIVVEVVGVFLPGDYRDWETDRKSTRLNSSHSAKSRMPSSA